jgi:hypothetical protein
LLTGGEDRLKHGISVLQNVIVPEAQCPPTECFQIGASLAVPFGSVLAAICFHNELAFDAREVGNKRTDGYLASEFETSKAAVAEPIPESSLRIGGVPSERSRMKVGFADRRHGGSSKEQGPHPLAHRRVDLSRKRARCFVMPFRPASA